MIIQIALVILGYLCGSVASAIIVCKIMHLSDPRTQGSGNPGATNVLRLHGKKAAVLTLAGDVAKGAIPVLIAQGIHAPDPVIALTGIAVFTGHLFPVFFNFHGGKGVATYIGILSATCWLLGLSYIGTWLLMVALTRYSSLSALIAAVLTPVYTALLLPVPAYIAANSIMTIALIWRHRANIRKLMDGTETRIRINRL
ncbi:MAG: glycerol-3-phosphate acyltransferase [Gammaproteobacteria bacterium RBG_16_51_14]|nr:MAG: glycerol-3-phosphate acyltransferase [Gammaproteobacteria bacterium RBG_16_51_14]